MGTTHLLWVLYDTGRVYTKFNVILLDYLLMAGASVVGVVILNYNREKFSKLFFLQQNKIQAMHNEQRDILKNLPDGAMIH